MPTPRPAADMQWISTAMGVPALAAPTSILDLLNYQMHLILSFSTAGVTRLCEREFGITRHEWGYIGLLAVFGGLAPSALALRSGMDRSRTSKALMPLVAKGLVERRVLGSDRRRATVQLTASGWALYGQLFQRVLGIHADLLQGWPPEDVAMLARLMERLRRGAVALEAGAAGAAQR